MCFYVRMHVCVHTLCADFWTVSACLPAQLTELKILNVVMMLLQEKSVWMVILMMVKNDDDGDGCEY